VSLMGVVNANDSLTCLQNCPGSAGLASLGDNPSVASMCGLQAVIKCMVGDSACVRLLNQGDPNAASGAQTAINWCTCQTACPGILGLMSLGDNAGMDQLCPMKTPIACITASDQCQAVRASITNFATSVAVVPAQCGCQTACPSFVQLAVATTPSKDRVCAEHTSCAVGNQDCMTWQNTAKQAEVEKLVGSCPNYKARAASAGQRRATGAIVATAYGVFVTLVAWA